MRPSGWGKRMKGGGNGDEKEDDEHRRSGEDRRDDYGDKGHNYSREDRNSGSDDRYPKRSPTTPSSPPPPKEKTLSCFFVFSRLCCFGIFFLHKVVFCFALGNEEMGERRKEVEVFVFWSSRGRKGVKNSTLDEKWKK